MFFQYPAVLLLLWILPVVGWLLVRAERKRSAAARRFVGQPMVPRLMPRQGGPRRWIKASLVLLSLATLIVAAARPRFGVYFEKIVRRGVDCFVLLDVSRSMLAEDVAPNRLQRAKSDIRDLLGKLLGDRVGLIVFAGKPALKVPLTTDEGFFRTVLDEVGVRSAPRGGTLIGDAIRKALAAMPPRADHDQVLVLITDGEDQDSYPIEAAEQAAERGVKIFTIGLGDSAEGARIPIRGGSGSLVYLKKDNGEEKWSKTNHNILVQIAEATAGAHVRAGTKAYDLGQVYEDHLAGLARGEDVQDQKRKRRRDRYQVFLMLAFALLAAEMLIPAHARAPQKCGTAAHGREERFARPRAAVPHSEMALKCLLAALLLLPAQAMASTSEAARKVDKGIDAFRGGDFKVAVEAFSAADRALPDRPRIAFNLGCAYAAEGEHDEAAEQFRAAALAQDVKLAVTARYNLGCLELSKAKTRFGERPEEADPEVRKEGIATLLQAAGNFRDALAIDPQHADARYNLEAVRLWIKHIKEVWRQRDRDKRRKEMNLRQFLQYLEGRQRELRSSGRALAETTDSPLRREAIRKIETEQRYLAKEIEPLKAKIAAALSGSPPQGGSTAPASGADVQKALALLNNLADEVHGAMHSAADSLAAANMPEAVASQSVSVEKLDQVFMAVAPFVNLVQKAIAAQQGLVDKSKGTTSTKIEGEKGKKGEKSDKGEEAVDWGEAAWNQRFISGYGRILPAKARRELEQLEKATAAAQPAMPAPQNGKTEDAAKAAEKKRALKAGMELAPKVEKLSAEAAYALVAARPADALPLQEEALKLLKEMLPKQEQQKNDRHKKKDQNKQDQQKKDQKKKDRQNKDQQKKDQQKKDRENDKTQARKQQQQEKLSKQEAQAVMRKARERRQQRKEMEKALRERLYRHEKVDKDW